MATTNAKAQCSICDDVRDTQNCNGCSQTFCFSHLIKHRERINEQFIQVQHDCNSFWQTLHDKRNDPMEKINQWEVNAIDQIKKTAEQWRQRLINYINHYIIKIENQLNTLTRQMEEIYKENKFDEFDLNEFKEKYKMLEEELHKSPKVLVKQKSTNNIIVEFDIKWKQDGITIAGRDDDENKLNQLSHPHGICIDDDRTIYIADYRSHHIIEWISDATNGRIVAGGNEKGNQTNQLHYPADVVIDKEYDAFIIADHGNRRVTQWSRQHNTPNGQTFIPDIAGWGLAWDKDGCLYVSDTEKHEVRRWKRGENNATLVADGNGQGDHLDQFDWPTFIYVDDDYSLYVSDWNNHRVMKWLKGAEEGIVVAGGNGEGNSLTQLSYPHGLTVDQFNQIYIADNFNHRVVRWCEGAKEGTIVVGGNEKGKQPNQLKGPGGLSFDREGNLYVADTWNNRIQKFEIDKN